MQFSPATIQILKNYAQINSNILFREGNTLATISSGKNLFSTAVIAETIPKEFAVYDLNSLLALLSLTENPDIEFDENSLHISKNGAKFQYFFSDASIIIAPPQKVITVDEHFKFDLSKEDISTIIKASSVMSAPSLSFISEGGEVFLKVGDPKVPGTNNYSKKIGDFDEAFNVEVGIENIKVIPENYSVALSKKKFIYMHNVERNLKYWIAAKPTSQI